MQTRTRLIALALASSIMVMGCKQGDAPKTGEGTDAPATAGAQSEASITGAGATFIFPLLSRWSSSYNKETGAKVNYQSIGSGGGIQQIKAGTVDFGSSDKPLKPEELAEAGLIQFPSAMGGVVPVINVEGVANGGLKLDGPTLADIFAGKITQWNDPKIAALNAGVTLPAAKINLVTRSDSSGTTYNFTNYLSKVSPTFKTDVGEDSKVNFPKGSLGGKGNEGVASYVKQAKNSIGYVELAYAMENGMNAVELKNAAGNFVKPTIESFQSAAASADWKNSKDFNLVITNAPGADAWPIAATNFILMHKAPKDPKRSAEAVKFFKWAYANGADQAKELHYVPLPAELISQVEAYIDANIAK